MNPANLPFAELRQQAIALRRAGKSRREIKAILGVTNNEALTRMLAGEPPAAWTFRPNARDEQRAAARQLREQGLTYREIADRLGVSKSSVSLWVRDLAYPGLVSYEEWRKRGYEEWRKHGYEQWRKRVAEARRAYWEVQRPVNEARREATRAAAAAEIGTLTGRELIIAGAVAYWCEGTKNKPGHRYDRVAFMNSDPGLIGFFLRFLDAAGIPREQMTYRVCIHEQADAEAAQRFWMNVTGAGMEQFRRPTLKRHNPRTTRTNVGDGYHGCLRVEVRRGSVLYRQIEGWARAAMAARPPGEAQLPGKDSNLR